MTYRRLTNLPLVDEKTGVTRGHRCNLITLYCPFCGRLHTLERKDVVHVDCGDEEFLCCYENVKDLIKND